MLTRFALKSLARAQRRTGFQLIGVGLGYLVAKKPFLSPHPRRFGRIDPRSRLICSLKARKLNLTRFTARVFRGV